MLAHFFQCPFCWEEISILLDSSVSNQTYIEDCEICCNPLEINIEIKNNTIIKIEVKTT